MLAARVENTRAAVEGRPLDDRASLMGFLREGVYLAASVAGLGQAGEAASLGEVASRAPAPSRASAASSGAVEVALRVVMVPWVSLVVVGVVGPVEACLWDLPHRQVVARAAA